MKTVDLQQAGQHLAELIGQLATEGDVVITQANRPVARLVAWQPTTLAELQPHSVGELQRPYPDPNDDLLQQMRSHQ